MTFMLGAFTNGLASGAENAMKIYSQYQDIKNKMDTSDKLQKAIDENNVRTRAAAGATPGQTMPGAASTGGSFLGGAQSDSAASAPKPSPDLNADPRVVRTGAALREFGDGLATMPHPGSPSPYGDAKSDSAASAPQAQPQQSQQSQGVQTNPTTGDTAMPLPPSAMPTPAQARSSQVFGSSVGDWLMGRNPQNRAVHLTPTMGIATGPGPSSTPMSTSPGGAPQGTPQYLPQGQSQPGQAAPQRPPALANGSAPGAPTLGNPQGNPLQALQTQYGNGGF